MGRLEISLGDHITLVERNFPLATDLKKEV
jgi:hypothetical protein